MNVADAQWAGFCFSYSPAAMVPEIPYIQDVLFALKLSPVQRHFLDAIANHPLYASNVLLAAAAVSGDIYALQGQDSAQHAPVMVARTIIDLCPASARCLFNPAYAEARKTLGEDVHSTSREDLMLRCGCTICRTLLSAENRTNACDL